jgi:hypothetical protein
MIRVTTKDPNTDKFLVTLIGATHFGGVVIEAPTGVIYTNQTGGCACQHPRLEGFFVFLNGLDVDKLNEHVQDLWVYGSEYRGLNVPVDTLDDIIQDRETHICYRDPGLSIDRIRIESEYWGEAWIPVNTYYGNGFLTWENSD